MGGPAKASGKAEVKVWEAERETPDFAKKWVRDAEPFRPVDSTRSLAGETDNLVRLEEAGSRRGGDRVFRSPAEALAEQRAPARPAVPAIELLDVRGALVGFQNQLKVSNRVLAQRFEKVVALTIDNVDTYRQAANKVPAFAANDGIRSALAASLTWLKEYGGRLQRGEGTFFDSIMLAHHLAIVNISM
jgi:hypothetical protein